jgi:hypothetical protein
MKQIIVSFDKRLTESEVDSALRGMSPRAFQSVLQILDDLVKQASVTASGYASSNNALAMALESGKVEILLGLIEDFSKRRPEIP